MNRQTAAQDSIHETFVPLPISLWILSLGADGVYLFHFGGMIWKDVALYSMAGGIGAAMASTIHGGRDSGRPDDAEAALPVQRTVWSQGAILLVYYVDVWFRLTTPLDAVLPVWLSLAALMLVSVSVKHERDRSSGMMEHPPHGVRKWHRAA